MTVPHQLRLAGLGVLDNEHGHGRKEAIAEGTITERQKEQSVLKKQT